MRFLVKRTQIFSVPLPVASANEDGHVSCTTIFAAHVPLRSQLVPQVLPLHVGVPASDVQTWPHEPQLLMVSTGVSQPFVTLPSQSPKPPLHTGVHAPPTQLVDPFAFVHGLPQNRQFAVDVFRLVSQPLPVLPSQSPVPAEQDDVPQTPLVQIGLPLSTVHTLVHVPQWVGSASTFASHPFATSPSQSAYPVAQTGTHTLFTQLVVPCALVQLVAQPLWASPVDVSSAGSASSGAFASTGSGSSAASSPVSGVMVIEASTGGTRTSTTLASTLASTSTSSNPIRPQATTTPNSTSGTAPSRVRAFGECRPIMDQLTTREHRRAAATRTFLEARTRTLAPRAPR